MSRTVKELAEEVRAAFYCKERDNGTEYVLLKDDAPEWMREVCRSAHGEEFLPDDARYRMIEAAVDALAHLEDDATPEDEDDAVFTIPSATEGEYSDVAEWLSSYVGVRSRYADEAVHVYGLDNADTFDRLVAGMDYEQSEVFTGVLASLRDLAEAFSVNEVEES